MKLFQFHETEFHFLPVSFGKLTYFLCDNTSFWPVFVKKWGFTKRVFCPCSQNQCSRNEFFVLITKQVLTKRVKNSWANKLERFNWQYFWFLGHYNQHSVLTSLVSKLTREIAHETSYLLLLTKRVFRLCSRNECSRNKSSRNEFLGTAHETNLYSWAQNTEKCVSFNRSSLLICQALLSS